MTSNCYFGGRQDEGYITEPAAVEPVEPWPEEEEACGSSGGVAEEGSLAPENGSSDKAVHGENLRAIPVRYYYFTRLSVIPMLLFII